MKHQFQYAFLLAALLVWNRPEGGVAQQPDPAEEETAEPVVGQLEHDGWGLVGPSGRHYVFGGLAVADYVRQGQRSVVTLKQEEPTLLPKPDENYLYYRELATGRRWAIGRYPLADDTYAVYLQVQAEAASAESTKASAKLKWVLFHRARLIWPEKQGEAAGSYPQISQMTQRKKASCSSAP